MVATNVCQEHVVSTSGEEHKQLQYSLYLEAPKDGRKDILKNTEITLI